MKMITKVFLVIAVLLICLIVWVLFLGGGGIIENAWNGIADQVNDTWHAITGIQDDVIPQWNSGGSGNVAEGNENLNVAGAGGGGGN